MKKMLLSLFVVMQLFSFVSAHDLMQYYNPDLYLYDKQEVAEPVLTSQDLQMSATDMMIISDDVINQDYFTNKIVRTVVRKVRKDDQIVTTTETWTTKNPSYYTWRNAALISGMLASVGVWCNYDVVRKYFFEQEESACKDGKEVEKIDAIYDIVNYDLDVQKISSVDELPRSYRINILQAPDDQLVSNKISQDDVIIRWMNLYRKELMQRLIHTLTPDKIQKLHFSEEKIAAITLSEEELQKNIAEKQSLEALPEFKVDFMRYFITSDFKTSLFTDKEREQGFAYASDTYRLECPICQSMRELFFMYMYEHRLDDVEKVM